MNCDVKQFLNSIELNRFWIQKITKAEYEAVINVYGFVEIVLNVILLKFTYFHDSGIIWGC